MMPAHKLKEQHGQAAQVVYLTDKPPQAVELLSGYPDLLRPSHIAELLGYSCAQVRELCRSGELPAVKVGNRWFVPKSKFLERVGG